MPSAEAMPVADGTFLLDFAVPAAGREFLGGNGECRIVDGALRWETPRVYRIDEDPTTFPAGPEIDTGIPGPMAFTASLKLDVNAHFILAVVRGDGPPVRLAIDERRDAFGGAVVAGGRLAFLPRTPLQLDRGYFASRDRIVISGRLASGKLALALDDIPIGQEFDLPGEGPVRLRLETFCCLNRRPAAVNLYGIQAWRMDDTRQAPLVFHRGIL